MSRYERSRATAHWVMPSVWLSLFTVTAVTGSYTAATNDVIATLLPAWKLAWHGTLQLPEYADPWLWITDGPQGVLSNRLPGAIVFAVPFYRILGNPDVPGLYPATIAAAFAATSGVVATMSAMRGITTMSLSIGAGLMLLFGTAAWTTAADLLWTHGPNMLWLGLGMVALSRNRYALAGLAFGAAIFTRPHLAFAAAVIGLLIAWRERSLPPALRIAATSSLGALALVVWNGLVWDRWHPLAGGYAGKISAAASSGGIDLVERWAGTFLSLERGVLIYSPFLMLLAPGLKRAWTEGPAWVQASALGGVVYLAAQLQQNGFGGGYNFVSNRLVVETLTLSTPLLALAWTHWTATSHRRRSAFAMLVWVSVFQHAVGAFVGDNFGGIHSHWTTYVIGERLSEGTPIQIAGLVAVMGITTWLLTCIVRSGPVDATASVKEQDHRPVAAAT